MNRRILLAVIAIIIFPMMVGAQGKGKGKGHGYGHGDKHGHGKNYGYRGKGGPPPWAPAHGYRAKQHVYFPDYHTFYDPYRGGYVYWNDGWTFSVNIPVFLGGVNLDRARMQLMNDVPLTVHPEGYYRTYSRRYPGTTVNINVPFPR